MPEVVFRLDISAEKLLGYYRGEVHVVQARTTTGQTVQFPASALRKLVAKDGIHGVFRMEFDQNNKFVRLEQLG